MSDSESAAEIRAAYGDTWYAATMVAAPSRAPLGVDLDVEVCVIGGGLAGLTTARELARRGWSVAVLEADRLASSASGRNTGFVLPGFGADAEKLVARVGFERSKNLWALSQAGLDYVRDFARADEAAASIDPQDELRDGWLHVSKVDNNDAFVNDVALLGELGCEIESWPTERVRAVLRSERYFYAVNYLRAFSIHPLNYALKLAAAAERDGARIFEHTPALSIDPAGVRKRIVTPGARVRADHVVLAGSVKLGTLMPRVAATLLPVTTYVITTAPLGEAVTEAVGYRGAVSDTNLADNHYRIVGGDRLMLSGRLTAWLGNPRRYVNALTRDIKKTYPQLGKVAVDHAWAGTLGLTMHRMPQIGELGPGVWLASGFGGHGLNTTAMAGNIIARAIADGDQTWRQFTAFELVWAGGVAGRAAGQLRFWTKRLRAAVAERRSRSRAKIRAKARQRETRRARDAELAAQQAHAAPAAQSSAAEEVANPPAIERLAGAHDPAAGSVAADVTVEPASAADGGGGNEPSAPEATAAMPEPPSQNGIAAARVAASSVAASSVAGPAKRKKRRQRTKA